MARLTITIERASEEEADTTLDELREQFGEDVSQAYVGAGRATEADPWS